MAKTVRFPLKMRDDIEVRTMGELKENWDMEKIVGYFLDGKLTTWLTSRRYEREAAQVELLEKDDKALRQNLSAIFGIEYIANESTEEDMEAIQAQQERLNKVRQYTTDKEILDTVDCAAFDQDDLWDILDTGAKKVYLVNNTFEISLEEEEMTYIGVGKAIAKIDSKEPVDFEALGIRFENVQFDEKYAAIQEKNRRYNFPCQTFNTLPSHKDSVCFHEPPSPASRFRQFHVLGIDHLAIACADLDKANIFWAKCMEIPRFGQETIEEQKVTTVFHPLLDGSQIELLVAASYDSPLARWIDSWGEGLQHVALRVDNIDAAIKELQKKGVRMIDKKARRGAGGKDIAFLHPESTGGILLEICELCDKRESY